MLYPSHERYGGFTTRENNTGLGRSSRPERLHRDPPFFLTRIHSIRHGSTIIFYAQPIPILVHVSIDPNRAIQFPYGPVRS
jgi:hypothetical protein